MTLQRIAPLLVVLLFAPALRGQETAPATSDAESRARAAFEEGRQLRVQGRWEEACKRFKLAHATFATGGTALSFADCEERAGRVEAARDLYLFILRDPRSASNAQRLAIARERLDALDRGPAPKRQVAKRAAPKPGPARSTPAPAAVSNPVPGAIVMGLGGAALVAGLIVGGIAWSEMNEVKDACPGDVCPPERKADADSAQNKGIAADVCLGVGGTAAVVGLVMLLTLESEPDAPIEMTAGGVQLRF
jgi:hypothetical protein